MTMLELLEESPIIAAIKSWEGLEKSLKSECKVVFVLFGTICDIAKRNGIRKNRPFMI